MDYGCGFGMGRGGRGIMAERHSDNMEEDLSKGTVLAVGGTGIYESGRKCNFHEPGPWMPGGMQSGPLDADGVFEDGQHWTRYLIRFAPLSRRSKGVG